MKPYEGFIIVYELTVCLDITEDVCIPILEKESGLKSGVYFKIGYLSVRINSGDKVHRLEDITKIVSKMYEESLEEIANIYELIIETGVHRVSSIKVAEVAKIAEKGQCYINIAFMNELAMVFDCMAIDISKIIEAMNIKWTALGFKLGLVGGCSGHCRYDV